MSNLYRITATLHTLAQEKAKKHGLELEIEPTNLAGWKIPMCYAPNGEVWQMNCKNANKMFKTETVLIFFEPQIRQILWVFRDVLGENPEYTATNWTYGGVVDPNFQNEELWRAKLERFPKSQAEALCHKWLDGLNPLINSEPETVLTELITILESI